MNPGDTYKRCPQCGQPADIDDLHCLRCGHQYRTQFTKTDARTRQVFVAPRPTPAPLSVIDVKPIRNRPRMRVARLGLLLLLLGAVGAAGFWFLGRPTSPLVGTWHFDTSLGTHVYIFQPDGEGTRTWVGQPVPDDAIRVPVPGDRFFRWRTARDQLYISDVTGSQEAVYLWRMSPDRRVLVLYLGETTWTFVRDKFD